MKKVRFAIAAVCCALVLVLGLVACNDTSTENTASNASSSGSSASNTATPSESETTDTPDEPAIDFPAEYSDAYGGVTLIAACELSGPEFTTLLKQLGYEWQVWGAWNKADTDDSVVARAMDYEDGWDAIPEENYEAATGKGDLAKGEVVLESYNYDDAQSAFDGLAKGLTVLDTLETGDENYTSIMSLVKDPAGVRYQLVVSYAADMNGEMRATATLNSDEYLRDLANGTDGIDDSWDYYQRMYNPDYE